MELISLINFKTTYKLVLYRLYNFPLSEQQFDEIVALYKQQYDLKVQNISCQKSVSAKHRFNEVKVDCEKYEVVVTTYPIELVE